MTTILRVDLTVGYDGVAVARDIGFDVAASRVLTVLGPNGAGKTTLLLTIAGFLPPIGGAVEVDGRPMRAGSPRRGSLAGVVLVPDKRALFTQLTTLENLAVARRGTRRDGPTIDDVLDLFPSLKDRAKVAAGLLSGGEQQMLALARALVQAPRVLLIDEMSMGLAPVIVESLMPVIRRVADESGAAVVLVEQHVGLALEIADDALVLVHGDVMLQQSAETLRRDTTLLEAAYLGAATHV